MERPPLSVVIGVHDAESVIAECLGALQPQAIAAGAEIIVADSSTDRTPQIVAREFPEARLLHFDQPLTLPELRGRGIAAAKGDVVAIIDAYSIVGEAWVRETLRAHADHVHPVIGGSVDLHEACRGSLLAWAVYLNEYGMFMPPVPYGEFWILPGSNIAYKRGALFDGRGPRFTVFWKTFANESLESSGAGLLLVPGMAVRLRKPIPFGDFLRTRLDHGRCYGGMRTADATTAVRAARAASCVLVPFVLQYRWTRAYLAKRRHVGVFMVTLPLQLLLFGAWAAGECVGYVLGQGRSCARLFY